jgi:hypothetical protein
VVLHYTAAGVALPWAVNGSESASANVNAAAIASKSSSGDGDERKSSGESVLMHVNGLV